MKRSTHWLIDVKRSVHTHRTVVGGVAAVVVLIGTLLLVAGRQEPTSSGRSVDRDASGAMSDVGPLNSAVLFYVAEDGTALVRVERDVPFGEDTLARARIIAEEQLIPPPAPLISPFPEGTTLRAVYLADGGDAFVDLSREVTLAHPGGSLDELFTVYALVNALTANLPEITAVQILVDGQEVDTLAGHVDLRRPLALNMKWVAPSEADREGDGPSPADD